MLPIRSTTNPPKKVPNGIVDHASTAEALCTRPSRRLGTIVWRKLVVLILKRMPRPEMLAQRIRDIQYQLVNAKITVNNPSAIRAPSATVLKDHLFLSGSAASARIITPMPPTE